MEVSLSFLLIQQQYKQFIEANNNKTDYVTYKISVLIKWKCTIKPDTDCLSLKINWAVKYFNNMGVV